MTAEAARLSADQAAGRYRALTLSERDGSFSVYHAELSGKQLRAFLRDREDAPGEGEQMLSVEAVQ